MRYRATPEHPFFDRFNSLIASAVSVNHKSISQIERDMGITHTCMQYYRKRKMLPSAETLLKIADYFGVSTDCLLGREGYELEERK